MDDVSGEWVSFDIPRAHQDSIWKLSWAHPEFGQVLKLLHVAGSID